MERGLINISSATTTTLVAQYSTKPAISSINICNCNQDENVKIRLFLDDGTNQTSYIENLNIPGGITLKLEDIAFDNSVLDLKLQTQGTGVDVNIIMR
jgi:hypothetical protein